MRRTDAFPTCPDVVVNSAYWEDMDEVAAFEELVGSHGGLGGGQAHPFVLHPADLPWPDDESSARKRSTACCAAGSRGSGQEDYADAGAERGSSSVSDSPTASVATRTPGAARAT